MNAHEAADLCNVAERTIRRWIASGKLPAREVGPRSKVKGSRTGPSAWEIDVDDLAKIEPVNQEKLAALPRTLAEELQDLRERVARLEEIVRGLQQT